MTLIRFGERIPIRWRVAIALLAFSFIGLGLTELYSTLAYDSEQHFYAATSWGWGFVVTLGTIFIVSMAILVPINVCLDRRIERKAKTPLNEYSWWQWLLLIPLHTGDSRARVPMFIAVPFLTSAIFLGGDAPYWDRGWSLGASYEMKGLGESHPMSRAKMKPIHPGEVLQEDSWDRWH